MFSTFILCYLRDCRFFLLLFKTHRQTPRQTHRYTQPFTPSGAIWRFVGALGRRLIAPLGLPPHCPLPGATTVAVRRLRCARRRICCHRPAPATGCGGLRWFALSRLPAILRSLSSPLLTSGRRPLAQLRTGLCAHSERQWKETPVIVAGMSRQMGSAKGG